MGVRDERKTVTSRSHTESRFPASLAMTMGQGVREEEKANGRRREVMEGSTRRRRKGVSAERTVEEDSLLGMDRAMTIHNDR
jgi:hypothetical protein